MRTAPWLLTFLALSASAAFGTTVLGEITTDPTGTVPAVDGAGDGTRRLASKPPLTLACWQEGRKIFETTNVYGISLTPLLERKALSLRTMPDGKATIFIVPFEHGLCLVRPGRVDGQ